MRISFIYGLKSMNMSELQILAGKYAINGSANWWSALEVNAKLIPMIHVVCFLPNPSIDNMQFPNIYFDKSNRFVFEVVYLLFWT